MRDNNLEVEFEETEKISTYLFEIAVGDWE